MSDNSWAVDLNEDNPDPRVACVVLTDVSSSMSGAPIAELEKGFAEFVHYLNNDKLASKRTEVALVTFGSDATVLVPMQEGRTLQPANFVCDGSTNMAAGINLALDIIEKRKKSYREAGIAYFRPWLIVMTDGAPDRDGFEAAVRRLNEMEGKNGVTVFAIGVGPSVNFETLGRLSIIRTPAPLAELKFSEFFAWLSASLSNVSNSTPFNGNDAEVRDVDQVPLPPLSGWTAA
ncbi:vWA domain-containing protein [Frankia tisae]|uniref:vWA domain-containing protein n=1 Tax=Frankia tisae TaxID=2950104 RepID=UPI0021C1CBFA|nr:VWA domain-containing protein [Frankia tisae]